MVGFSDLTQISRNTSIYVRSVMAEDKLIDVNMKNLRMTKEQKLEKCHGILKLIEPCAHVLEVNFPLLRDNGK